MIFRYRVTTGLNYKRRISFIPMTHSLSTLLKKYNLHPRKGLGQNFLADPHHLKKIIEAAELDPNDLVVEIGPGPGILTRLLTAAAGQVVAVELDSDMVNLLHHEFGHLTNLTIIEADILNVEVASLLSAVSSQPLAVSRQDSELGAQNPKLKTINYKVVANLPYYITSAVLRHLLEATPKPQQLVVTVQKEVAQRIVAGPGKMSLLAVSIQFYGQPTLVHYIPAGAFYPAPKVDSAVVRIDTYPQPAANVTDINLFFEVVKAGFGQKRKQLKNALASGLHKPVVEVSAVMHQAGIDPTRRAETLSLQEWGQLVEAMWSVL